MVGLPQLEAQLLDGYQDDLQKIDLLNEIVFQLRFLNPRRSQELMAQAEILLTAHPDYAAGQVMLHINQASHAWFQRDYDAALAQLVETVGWCREHEQPVYLMRALGFLGTTYTFGGEAATGLETLLEALSIAERLGDKLGQAMILGDLGVAHGITEIPERLTQALSLTQQALGLFKELDDTYGIAVALNNIGAIFTRLNDVTQALEYGQECLHYAQKNQNIPILLIQIVTLAKLFAKQGEADRARVYLAQSSAILEQMREVDVGQVMIAGHYYQIATIYQQWGELSTAETLLIEGIQTARDGHVRHTEYQCHELLAAIYEQQGECAKALEHYRQFHVLKEQVFNQESEDRFKRLSASHQLKQAQLEAEHERILQVEGQRHIQRLQSVIGELESFSYSVAHDLRAPLRHITGISQILKEDYGPQLPNEAQDYIERIVNAGQRMDHLIVDLLRLSQITRSNVQISRVDLSALAQEIIERLQSSQAGRAVGWTVMPDLETEGDSGMLRVALENLLDNAWKYTGKRADVQIVFGREERDGEEVYFVRDNGAGFDMQFAGKLFGAFQRLHRADEFEGTGVGLATVKRVIERHGGRIWAESAVEQGATFFFTLHKPLEH